MPIMVWAITCPLCRCTIFSRANHDYHTCPCGAVAVDGGFSEYGGRVLWESEKVDPPTRFDLEVDSTRQDLYDDWNRGIDKFGIIEPPSVYEQLAEVEGE